MDKKKTLLVSGAALSTLPLGLLAYMKFVEKRSFASIMAERSIAKKYAKMPKTDEEFEFFVKMQEEISDKELEIPEQLEDEIVTVSYVDSMQVFTLNNKENKNQKVIIYFHGGAYISQPVPYHYDLLTYLTKKLDAKIVMPIYPKAPKNNYQNTYPILLKLYNEILNSVDTPNQITLMGDSSGGTLALGLGHLLAQENIEQPKDIIALSPWVDIATQNPEIKNYEVLDPMLTVWLSQKEAKLWAIDEENMQDPLVSPLFSNNFEKMAKTTIFVGTNEILYPDNELLHEKLLSLGIEHNFIVKKNMMHDYAIFPIPEAKKHGLKL